MCFLLELAIGMSGDERSDLFGVVVCTPVGGRRLPSSENGTVSLRGLFVFADFSWNLLWKTLDTVLLECSAENWVTSVELLQRYFRWEYEGMAQQR